MERSPSRGQLKARRVKNKSSKEKEDTDAELWRCLKEKLASEITKDELTRMKKLSEPYLKRTDLRHAETTVRLLQELERCEVIRSSNVQVLSDFLEDIGRTDLALEVLQYSGKLQSPYQLRELQQLQRQLQQPYYQQEKIEKIKIIQKIRIQQLQQEKIIQKIRIQQLQQEEQQQLQQLQLDFYKNLQGSSQSPATLKKIYRGRIMLVGAYGAGKTSTKRSLFNEPYEEQHLSTDGADIYNIDITEWIIKEFTTTYHDGKSIEETQKTLGDTLVLGMAKQKSLPSIVESEVASKRVADLIDAVKFKGEKMKDVRARLTQRLKEATDVEKPDIYFSLWDFAGQSVYYITHQVFLGNRVIFVLVTDLTKSLEDTLSTVVEDEWTVKEFLSFWLNSIHTHADPGSNVNLKLPNGDIVNSPAPPVIILGTKKDLLGQSKSGSSDDQNQDIEREAENRLQEISDYIVTHATKAVKAHIVSMGAIDNKSRRDDGTVNDPEVAKLIKKIQDYALEYFFHREVPVNWIRLELSMRKLHKKKIDVQEATRIGKELEMEEREINKALAFFHSIGEILHYTSIPELKDIIILDVEWLVNLFKILITQPLAYKKQVRDVSPNIRSLIDELHHEGRLHEELLDYLLKRHDRLEDKAVLLATSEMYDILFQMPETDGGRPLYYLPSLLQKDPAGKNGVVCPAESMSCAPIYFHFHGNFLPDGVFYRLVVRCLKIWPNQAMVLRKHRARIFIENDDIHLALSKNSSDIELKALIMPDTHDAKELKPELVRNVRIVVEEELKKVINTYTPNVTYKICIKCQCPNHRPGKLLPGSEDTDDRCVAVKEHKGKVTVTCDRGARQVPYPDLQLWYDTGDGKAVKCSTDNDNSLAKFGIGEQETANKSILTIGHEWDIQKGGIATLHRLTSSLAAETGRKVHATALEANKEGRDDATSKGVRLMLPVPVAGNPDAKPDKAWLNTYYSYHYPSLLKIPGVKVVIGHLLITSKEALEIQRNYYQDKKIILFNHVSPEDTEVKLDEFTPSRVQKKETIILEEVSKSHVVFSVGPRVYQHFEGKFSSLKSVKHELFLPMPDAVFFQLGIKKPSTDCLYRILTYGRIDDVTQMKGYDVVTEGLSRYVTHLKRFKSPLNPPVWQISGVKKEQVQAARDCIQKHVTSGYLEYKVVHNWSKDQIKSDLKDSQLCLIPSHVEPFGMIGLEAIAAGIPVLVNGNSSLAKFLTKYMQPDVAAAVIVDVGVTDTERERDICQWYECIAEVFGNYDYAFNRAQDMQEMLRDCPAIKKTHEVFKQECCV